MDRSVYIDERWPSITDNNPDSLESKPEVTLMSFVSLGRTQSLSVPQFPYLYNMSAKKRTYVTVLLRRIKQ